MSETIESVVVIKADTSQAEQSAVSLKQQIKNLKNELLSMDQTSAEYAEGVQRLGNMQHQMTELTEQSRMATQDFGAVVGNCSKVLQGGVGAVAGLTAGLSLLGVELGDDSELTAAFVKALTLMQSLASIDSMIKAFRGLRAQILATKVAQRLLNAEMAANPIGAIVLAVAALVAGLIALVKWMDKTTDESKKMAAQAEATIKSLDGMKKQADYQYRYAQACGATTAELRKLKEESLKAAIATARLAFNQAEAAKNKKATDEAVEAWRNAAKALKETKEALSDYYKEIKVEDAQAATDAKKKAQEEAKSRQEAAAARAKAAKDAKATDLDIMKADIDRMKQTAETADDEIAIKKKEIEYAIAVRSKMKEGNKDYLNQTVIIEGLRKEYERMLQAKKEAADQKAVDDVDKSIIEREISNDITYMNKRNALIRQNEEDINSQVFESAEKRNAYMVEAESKLNIQLADLQLERLRQQRQALEEQYENDHSTPEKQQAYLKQKAELDAQEIELERKKNDEIVKINDRAEKAQEEIRKRNLENYKAMADGMASLLSSIADNLKEDTQEYKFLKAAEAIINTISAAVAAFAGITSETGGWGIAAAIAQAAAVTAAGMAQVRKIYAVDTSGKSSNSTSGSFTSAAIATLSATASNVRLTGTNGNTVDLSGLESKIGNQKVWVSVRDINDAQDSVKRTQVRNRF